MLVESSEELTVPQGNDVGGYPSPWEVNGVGTGQRGYGPGGPFHAQPLSYQNQGIYLLLLQSVVAAAQ